MISKNSFLSFLLIASFFSGFTQSVTLTPTADAYVRNGTYATLNYGADTSLHVKAPPSTTSAKDKEFTRSSYLKFSLNTVSSVTGAKLRFYGKNIENTTSIIMAVFGVNVDSWTETGITWNNAPAASSSTALGSVGVNNIAKYYEVDVTAFVKAQFAGDKTVSFLLKNPSKQNRDLVFNSRQNNINQPQLVITMAPSNQPPVLTPIGPKSAIVGQPFTFTASAYDPDDQSLTYSITAATGKAVINSSSGVFNWTPSASGDSTFTIRVSDNGSPSLFDDETIIITVASPNQPPVLDPIGPKPATVDQPMTFTAKATDPDGQPLTYSITAATGNAVINTTSGVFSWTPTASGDSTFTIRASDNSSPFLYDDETITITVSNPPNEAPILASIGPKSATQGQAMTFTAKATDYARQMLTYSLMGSPEGAGVPDGATINPTTGVFDWTPAASGDFPITIQVSDNGSPVLSAEETITISVAAPNEAPVLTIQPQSAVTYKPFTFTATATDDPGQTLSYSITDATGNAVIDPTSGVFSWTPSASGDSTFTINVSDNGTPVMSASQVVHITVADPPNQAPVLEEIGSPQNAMLGTSLTFTAKAMDDPHQSLIFSLVNSPAGAAINAVTGAFSWSPTAAGSFQATVMVSDNGTPALTDQETFTIIVGQPNRPPVLTAISNKTVIVGDAVTFTAEASDLDANSTLNFYLIDAPDDATIDETSGEFSWTTAETGTFTFTVHVSDDGEPALSDEKTLTITVNAVNQPPVLTPIGDKTGNAGQVITFTAKANDDPNQTKTFSLVGTGVPSGATINATTGVFNWTPATGGVSTFKVRVTDNGSPVRFVEEQITITVSSSTFAFAPVADAMVRNGTAYATTNYGSDTSLLVKGSPTSGFARNSYLRFSLSGVTGSVASAKLRLYGFNNLSATSIIASVYSVTNDTWDEKTITWNNVPAQSPTLITSTNVNNVKNYYEWDVTAFVQAELSGDKLVSFVLKNPSNQDQTLQFNSRENAVNNPQLLISTTSSPTNMAPVLAPINNKNATANQTLTFIATATDPDANQTKTFSLIGAPAGATISTSGTFNWTPDIIGSYSFTVRVTDNGSPVYYDEEQITVTVTGGGSTLSFSNSQTTPIPNPGTVSVPIVVSGLPAHIDTTAYGLQYLTVQITHPVDKELTLQLKSPDGRVIYLFRKSPGVNINTTFDAVSKRFIDNNEIAAYTGSFSSGYRPRQELSLLNNNQNPNGTWNLVVKDDASGSSTGTVTGVTLVFGSSPAKPLLTSSNLPIIKIYTAGGADIVDDPKVLADMYVINNNTGLNYANQTTYQFQGKIGIEIRGNSSASHATIPKKQYGFETRAADGVTSIDTSFFGMPAESDWILSALQSDKSFIRNVLTYQIAREMGQWASRTKFCEVMINDEYRGVFVFEEKIKKNKNRVDIKKLTSAAADQTTPNVTGGYIFAVDDLDPGDITWQTLFDPKPGNPYKFVYPKPDSLQPAQRNYLQTYVGSFETALHGASFQDPVNGFRKYADDKSFYDFFIINEFAKNNDAYRYSTYFYKERGKLLKAGPVWDIDRGFRNEATCNSFLPSGYIYSGTNNCEGRITQWWWARLLEDTKYKNDMICRYNTLRQTTLSQQRIDKIIDSCAAILNGGAQQRNFIRWDIMGKYVERIPKPYSATYAIEIDTLKQWCHERLAWLDNDLGPCPTGVMARSASHEISNPENNVNAIGSVYPSPFKNKLSVTLSVSKAQNVNVQLLDMNGRIIYEKKSLLQKGPQLINLNFAEKPLISGLYILNISGTNINFNRKVLKE